MRFSYIGILFPQCLLQGSIIEAEKVIGDFPSLTGGEQERAVGFRTIDLCERDRIFFGMILICAYVMTDNTIVRTNQAN